MRTQTQSLMPALGDEFVAAREARGLSLSDVAEQIHIRTVYLVQIEKENWSAIGAPVYVRGFLRTYARFLGLDPEKAVARFNESLPANAPSLGPPPASSGLQATGSSPVLWIAGSIAALLVAFVIYNSYTLGRTHRAPAPHSAAGAGVWSHGHRPRRASRRLRPVAPTATLAVRLTEPSWLRVTIDGNVSLEGTFPPGTLKQFHGKRADVRVGNAGGVDLTVNGRHIGKLGAIGNVAERTFALQE